jgi:hypothetical protein
MDDNMIRCPNCQRNVPSTNIDVHTARCNRRSDNNIISDNVHQQEQHQEQQEQHHQQQDLPPPQQQQQQQQHMWPFFSRTRPNSQSDDVNSNNNTNNNFTSTNNRDWVVVDRATAESTESDETSSPRNNNNVDSTIQLGNGQWQCSRCTLINEAHHDRCEACLLPQHPTVRDLSINNGSVTQRNGAVMTRMTGSNVTHQQRMNNLSTANRVINGALNGAMVGSVFGGLGGLIVGGLTGAASGIFLDRIRQRGEQLLQTSERDLLLNDNGGLQPGTMRVHRGENYIMAASTNRNGATRVLRIRYGGNGNNQRQPQRRDQEEMERALLELLLRSSYNHPMALGMEGSNTLIQPDASFEDLLERFGSGVENRAATQQVIDSYPVEIVSGGGGSIHESDESDDESAKKKPKIELGTCGICLEDYQAGDEKKSLSCPHAFHKGCIDQWLKRVASCPICKAEVGMYTQPSAKKGEEAS